jgi:restriction system protein
MARRKRQGNADVIVDLVALLPWWGGLGLALASYFVFHAVATRKVAIDPRHVAGSLPAMWFSGIAMALQYVIPALCVIAALVSFLKQRKRASLVTATTSSRSAESLNAMSWQEFELLVGEAFRLQGFQVSEQGGPQADGGVDLRLRRGNETFLVQCKQWKALKVGVDVVRELYGVMAAEGAAGGFVVTSGRFTDDAVAFAAGRNVRLIDGGKLFGLLQQARAASAAKSAAQPLPPQKPPIAATEAESPTCPKCNSAMVRRTANKGANAGSEFWGCSKFPACYGTR